MKMLQILTAFGFAAVIASPAVAAPQKHPNLANPAVMNARAQAAWTAAPATGADYVGTDPDQNIRSELQRDPPAARQ